MINMFFFLTHFLVFSHNLSNKQTTGPSFKFEDKVLFIMRILCYMIKGIVFFLFEKQQFSRFHNQFVFEASNYMNNKIFKMDLLCILLDKMVSYISYCTTNRMNPRHRTRIYLFFCFLSSKLNVQATSFLSEPTFSMCKKW